MLDFSEILQISHSKSNEELLKYYYVALDLLCFVFYSSNNLRFEYHLLSVRDNISKENFKLMKQILLEKQDHHFSKQSIFLKICSNKSFCINHKELLEKSFKILPILVCNLLHSEAWIKIMK